VQVTAIANPQKINVHGAPIQTRRVNITINSCKDVTSVSSAKISGSNIQSIPAKAVSMIEKHSRFARTLRDRLFESMILRISYALRYPARALLAGIGIGPSHDILYALALLVYQISNPIHPCLYLPLFQDVDTKVFNHQSPLGRATL
jgi:hypothetical protein